MNTSHEDLIWHRPPFIISTKPSYLQPDEINDAFASPDLYYTNRFPEDKLKELLSNSLCLGLYEITAPEPPSSSSSSPTAAAAAAAATTGAADLVPKQSATPPGQLKQVGFQRIITDKITFAYTTDYYVLPPYRKLGLGEWMQDCTSELLDLMDGSMNREIRGFRVLSAIKEENAGWYEEKLKMKRIVQGEGGLVFVQRSGVRDAEGEEEDDDDDDDDDEDEEY